MQDRAAPVWTGVLFVDEVANGTETSGGPGAAARPSNLLRDLFDRARVQPCLQAAARPARPDLSAISGDAGAVGARWRARQEHRRTAVSGFRYADAAAQAAGGGGAHQTHAQ